MPWDKSNNNQSEFNPWNKKNSDCNKKLVKFKLILLFFLKKISSFFLLNKIKIYFTRNMNLWKKINNSIFFIFIICFFIWFIFGFYVIKPSQKGIVTKFGKFIYMLEPGVYWKPKFINQVKVINVNYIHKLFSSGILLTIENNFIKSNMRVEYRIINPVQYYFFSINSDRVVQQISDNVLNNLSGHINMNDILINNQKNININLKNKIQSISDFYQLGIKIVHINCINVFLSKLLNQYMHELSIAKLYKKNCIQNAEKYSKRVLNVVHEYEKKIMQELKSYKICKIIEIEGKIYHLSKIKPINKK